MEKNIREMYWGKYSKILGGQRETQTYDWYTQGYGKTPNILRAKGTLVEYGPLVIAMAMYVWSQRS